MNAFALRPLPVAAFAASSTEAGYLAANAGNDHAGVVWKSAPRPSSGFEWIRLDFGSPQTFDTVMLFGCSGSKATWTAYVTYADDSAWTVNVGSIAEEAFHAGTIMPVHGRGVALLQLPAPVTRRYCRIHVTNMATGEVVTVARVAVGLKLQLERNFAFGAGFGVRDLGSVDFSRTGVMLRRRAPKLRTVGLTFPAVRKDEIEQKVQPLVELCAGQEPIALVTDPEPHAMRQRRCYFGPMIGDLGTIWKSAAAWEWRANLIDLIPAPKA